MTTQPPAGDWLEPLASLDTTTNSFIVTIRTKPLKLASQLLEWHGSVEHAQSRERIYFIDYARLNKFIASRCQTPLPPPWRARLSRRWHTSRWRQFLYRLKYTRPVNPLPVVPR